VHWISLPAAEFLIECIITGWYCWDNQLGTARFSRFVEIYQYSILHALKISEVFNALF
jgi:hypothetical protein